MAIRLGEITIAEENSFSNDGIEVSSVKKITYLNAQKFIGILSKEPSQLQRLERYAYYCLYAENNDLTLSYAIESEDTIILIDKLDGSTYVINEEQLDTDIDQAMAVIEAVEGHFGGHGATHIEMSADEIKSRFCGESKVKLFVLLGLVVFLLVGMTALYFSMQEDPLPPPPAQEAVPLVLSPEDENEMKRLGTIKAIEAIEAKLLEISNSPFDSDKKKVSAIVLKELTPSAAAPGEYPKLEGSISFSIEYSYPAVGTERVSETIFSATESTQFSVARDEAASSAKPEMSEHCLTLMSEIDITRIFPSKRDANSVTVAILDADAVDTLRKLRVLADGCPVKLETIVVDNKKATGSFVAYGFSE